MEKTNIMIATPAYNHQIHTDYLHSVMGFMKADIKFSVVTIGNESLITRARNTLLKRFVESEEFTHLLFLDADIYLRPEDLETLINHQKDVVGAPVSLKHVDEEGNKRFNFGQLLDPFAVPAVVSRVGTAVFMLSRNAIQALVDDAKTNGQTYMSANGSPPGTEATEHFDVFRVGVVNEEYLSEDFWVCHKLRELGFNIHVDLSIKTKHFGVFQF